MTTTTTWTTTASTGGTGKEKTWKRTHSLRSTRLTHRPQGHCQPLRWVIKSSRSAQIWSTSLISDQPVAGSCNPDFSTQYITQRKVLNMPFCLSDFVAYLDWISIIMPLDGQPSHWHSLILPSDITSNVFDLDPSIRVFKTDSSAIEIHRLKLMSLHDIYH